jgi:hypothetical protein
VKTKLLAHALAPCSRNACPRSVKQVNQALTPAGKLRFADSSTASNEQPHLDTDDDEGFSIKRVSAFGTPERAMGAGESAMAESPHRHAYDDRQSPVRIGSNRSTRVGAPKRNPGSRSRLDRSDAQQQYDDQDDGPFASPGVPPTNCNPFYTNTRDQNNNSQFRNRREIDTAGKIRKQRRRA